MKLTNEEVAKVLFYVLKCPISGKVRYVGKTERSIKWRLYKHYSGTQAYVGRWVAKLKRCGLRPIAEQIDSCKLTDNWQEKEREWIKHYRNEGNDLCNLTDGGEGLSGYKMTKDNIDFLSKRMSKEVYCFNGKGNILSVYASIRKCGKDRNCSPHQISNAIKNGLTVKGMLFSFTATVNIPVHKYRQNVCHVDDQGNVINIYESAGKAALALGLKDRTFLLKVCKGIYSQYKGFKFKFKSDVVI